MPPTTTAIVATNAKVWIDNAAGTPVDVSGSSNRIEISPENGIAEFRAFGQTWRQRRVTGKDVSMSFNVIYTTASDEAVDVLKTWFFGGSDAARTVSVYLPDKNVGSDHFYGEFVLASLSIPLDAEADEVVRVSCDLRADGQVYVTAATT